MLESDLPPVPVIKMMVPAPLHKTGSAIRHDTIRIVATNARGQLRTRSGIESQLVTGLIAMFLPMEDQIHFLTQQQVH